MKNRYDVHRMLYYEVNERGMMMATISYVDDFSSWVYSFSFSIPIKVRFSDTDAYGHLNNTKVFVYFEEARIEFLKKMNLFSYDMPTMLVVRDMQCDYLQEVFFDDQLTVYCKVGEIGRTSVDLHYMAKNEKGEVVLTARGRLVQLSKETKRPFPWPKSIKNQFSSFL